MSQPDRVRTPTIGATFGRILSTVGGIASMADEATLAGTSIARTAHVRAEQFEETERLKGIAKHWRLRHELIEDCDGDVELAAALGVTLPPIASDEPEEPVAGT